MKYEYFTTYIFGREMMSHTIESRQQELAFYTSEGWELICVDNDYLYFKRPVKEE